MKQRNRLNVFGAGVLACLLGCTTPDGSYRTLDAPIGATSRFNAAEFSGNWIIIESFQQRRMTSISFDYQPSSEQLVVAGDDIAGIGGAYRQGVPGELIPLSPEKETLVVMWVDDDFRTAVLGTPSGSLGLVLDRTGDLPPDRAQAVRDILGFYGWDVSRLKRTL